MNQNPAPIVCDSLIFDMDGTLWDAVDSYCKVWDKTFADFGIDVPPVKREELLMHMGRHLEDMVRDFAPDFRDHDEFTRQLDRNEQEMMPVLGGRLYPGAAETIKALSSKVKVLMVSNCGSCGLVNFANFTGLKPYITAHASHGSTGLDKTDNIIKLVREYGLKQPWYVGDTQGDSDHAHKAGVKMIFCTYGFGHVTDPDYTINDIRELADAVQPLQD
jgi:phosphoglycolate phosphatase